MLRLLSLLCACAVLVQAQLPPGYELIWSDEFDGDSINPDNWQHEITAWGGGNEEFQVYTDDPLNSYVRDGSLFIKPTRFVDITNPLTGEPFGEDYRNPELGNELDLVELYGRCTMDVNGGCFRDGDNIPPIASARIRSFERFAYRYGYAEIRMRAPIGDWTWPALWLLPEDWVYGEWPLSGEIDMMEGIGNRQYVCDGQLAGIQNMGSTLHWGLAADQNKWFLTHNTTYNETQNFGEHFHLYAYHWTPNGMEFFVDNQLILTIPDPLINDEGRAPNDCFEGFYDLGAPWDGDSPWTGENTCDFLMAPFDQRFHFILNVAVGGTCGFIPDGCTNWDGEDELQKPWPNSDFESGDFVGQYEGMNLFYDAVDAWYPTWEGEGENLAMQIDYVRVYRDPNGYSGTSEPSGCDIDSSERVCPFE